MSVDSSDPFTAIEDAAARQVLVERAAQALSLARATLILGRDAKSAFFACLALRLKPEVDWDCGTMATDGKVLAYHPGFVAGLAPDELVGVLAHEVMHIALAHPFRRGLREETRWNIACDLAVNPLLLEAGVNLPAGRLVPGEGTYAALPPGKSAEEYYALLGSPPEPGSETDGAGNGAAETSADPGGCGGVREPGHGSPAEARDAESECLAAVAQAERAAQGRGQLPGGLSRSVDHTLRPPADWKHVLRAFVTSQARDDYSWTRPNRRYIAQGWYLPGLHSDTLGDVVLAIDTSGSVGAKELGVFASEANAVLEAFDCSVTVLYHDTEVQKVSTWKSSDGPLTLECHSCCLVQVDDPEPLHKTFSEALRAKLGKLPVSGFPRITRFKPGQTRFTVVDPNGNSVVYLRRDESEGKDQKLTGLPTAIATATRLRDSKNDDKAAAKVLDVALGRYTDAPPLERARALAARAELAVALGEKEKLAAVRAELQSVPLSDADREAYRHELQAADELERTQR